MNVEIETEAAQFLFWEYKIPNFFAVWVVVVLVRTIIRLSCTQRKPYCRTFTVKLPSQHPPVAPRDSSADAQAEPDNGYFEGNFSMTTTVFRGLYFH